MGKTGTFLSYPSDQEGRLLWWNRRIEHFYSFIKPWMDASETLISQYSISDATEREKYQHALGLDKTDPAYRVKTNIVFGWIDQSVASLASFDPTFRVTALNKQAAGKEYAVSRISNDVYRRTGQLEQDERVLLDAHLCPWGGAKIGYSFDVDSAAIELEQALDQAFFSSENPDEEGEYMVSGLPVTALPDQNHQEHIELHTIWLQQPTVGKEQAAIINDHINQHKHFIERPTPDVDNRVKWDLPFGQRWDPAGIIIDPFANDGVNDAMFIGFRYRLPVDMVKANPQYSNTKDLEPTDRMLGAPDKVKDFEFDDFGTVDLFEIWGRNIPIGKGRTSKFFGVFADGHDKWLSYEEEWPYDTDDYPLELLHFHSSVNTWFNKPPMLLAGGDSIQSLTNEILDSMLSIIRKQKNIFLYDPEYIQADEIEALMQGDDMSAYEIDGLADANGKAVVPLEFGNIQNDKNHFLSQIQAVLDRSAGTPQPVRSASPESATEANIIDHRASSRDDKRGAKFNKYQINKARKFWDLMVEFRPNRVFLLDQVLEEVSIDDDIASGRFDFKIDISSSATARGLERKQWMDLLNLLSGNLYGIIAQQYGQPPNIARLLELLLVRGYDIFNPEEILPFLPSVTNQGGPNDAAMVMQQVQKAMMENTNGPADPSLFINNNGVAPSRIAGDANRRDRGGSFGNAGTTAEGA